MLSDGDPARAAIFPELSHIDLFAGWEGRDTKTSDRVIPEESAVLASPTAESINRAFRNSARCHSHTSLCCVGKQRGKHSVSKIRVTSGMPRKQELLQNSAR